MLTVGNSFMVMVTLIIFGICLSAVMGIAHDTIYTALLDMGIDAGAGDVGGWDSTRELFVIDALLAFICSLPPLLGVFIFFIACTKRQRRSEYYELGERWGDDSDRPEDWR